MTERYPLSLNAVNVVCFKIDWDETCVKSFAYQKKHYTTKEQMVSPWWFVNVDETVEDAALRKFVEETGIAPHI